MSETLGRAHSTTNQTKGRGKSQRAANQLRTRVGHEHGTREASELPLVAISVSARIFPRARIVSLYGTDVKGEQQTFSNASTGGGRFRNGAGGAPEPMPGAAVEGCGST